MSNEPKEWTGAVAQDWFDKALNPGDPRPSPAVCATLVREIKVIVNRQNNIALERSGAPISKLKDVDPATWVDPRMQKFQNLRQELLDAAYAIPSYTWEDSYGTISISEVQDFLIRIGIGFAARSAVEASKGRRATSWHAVARQIAPLIERVMKKVGYKRSLSGKKPDSVTARVGAAVLSWAFGITDTPSEITPEAFAAAMRQRSRSSKKGFLGRFPAAARIKILHKP
jgi:hypothetical protein